MSVCLCLAAFPHYCTDPDVSWRNGRGCPVVVLVLALCLVLDYFVEQTEKSWPWCWRWLMHMQFNVTNIIRPSREMRGSIYSSLHQGAVNRAAPLELIINSPNYIHYLAAFLFRRQQQSCPNHQLKRRRESWFTDRQSAAHELTGSNISSDRYPTVESTGGGRNSALANSVIQTWLESHYRRRSTTQTVGLPPTQRP